MLLLACLLAGLQELVLLAAKNLKAEGLAFLTCLTGLTHLWCLGAKAHFSSGNSSSGSDSSSGGSSGGSIGNGELGSKYEDVV
jgi:hypothetical protein